uniref:Uncharacterized protein n=2 Tax=Oryza TaxID=4527 RepID=A0A0D3EIK0_9ORYZ
MSLKNSGHFLNQRSHKTSLLPTPEEEAALAASATGGPSFVLHTSIAPNNPSSQITSGLTIRHAVTESEKTVASSAAIEPKKMSHAPIVDAHIEDTQWHWRPRWWGDGGECGVEGWERVYGRGGDVDALTL